MYYSHRCTFLQGGYAPAMLGMDGLSGERRKPASEDRPEAASSDRGECVEIDMRQNPRLARSARQLVPLPQRLAVITPTGGRWNGRRGIARADLEFAPPTPPPPPVSQRLLSWPSSACRHHPVSTLTAEGGPGSCPITDMPGADPTVDQRMPGPITALPVANA